MADPTAEPLQLPAGYGAPAATLDFGRVRARVEQARHHCFVTVRADGRLHAVPVDGLWVDDACVFGGSPDTAWHRSLRANRRAVVHLEDAEAAVIVEGSCEWLHPDRDLADRLAAASQQKYGYAPDPADYAAQGVWRLRPARARLGALPRDATRFVIA